MAKDSNIAGKSKYSYWQSHIDCWCDSGLSQAHYCKQNKLASSTFSYWKKKLSELEKPSTRFYPLTVQTSPQLENDDSGSGLRLIVSKRRFEIDVAKDFSSATLMRLMDTLEKCGVDGVLE